jgi:hypothetical protein
MRTFRRQLPRLQKRSNSKYYNQRSLHLATGETMHKLSAVLLVLLAVGLRAQAQDTPKAEVFTGYSFMSAGFPFSTDPAAGNGTGF